MLHILKPRPHGVIDYAAILVLAAAPSLFGFGDVPAHLCYAIAGVYLLMSALTAYPLSLAKVIPFPVHGAVELVLAPVLIALPWLANFDEYPVPRNFFIVMGAALAGAWLVTDYKAAEHDPESQPRRRSHA